jgi:hypothetical protein
VNHTTAGYLPLPDWPEVVPDPNVRSIVVCVQLDNTRWCLLHQVVVVVVVVDNPNHVIC